jgi:hypothetical protein
MQSSPNARTITRPTYSIATSHSDPTACAASSTQAVSAMSLNSRHCARSRSATACAVPPAQALPRVSFAARTRKAGRCVTAPLAQLHPRKSSTKDGASTPPLPLAQVHPRKALPRVSFAARIRKAGRCLTAPIARRHPRKSSACRRPRPAEAQTHKRTTQNGFESSEVNRRYRD